MKRLIGTSVFCLLSLATAFGQHVHDASCGTYRSMEKAFEQQPELRDAYYASQLLANSMVPTKNGYDSTTVYRIPVVFHIIHDYGSENIPDSRVYEAMRVINREFNANDPDSTNLVSEYLDLNGNAKIEFYLASKDPEGNCTNGIDHVYSHETHSGDDNSKLNQWNRAHYLNIWSVDFLGQPGAAAYAFFPSATNGLGFWRDGVISQVSYVGNDGSSSEMTLTHEIGHYLSLPHTFGSSDLINNGPTTCEDDGFPDTPVTRGHTSCPAYPYGWIDCGTRNTIDTTHVYEFEGVLAGSGTVDALSALPEPLLILDTDTSTAITYSTVEAVGVGSNATTNEEFGFDGWDTGANDGETDFNNLTGSINTSKYYEFTMTPQDGVGAKLNYLTFKVNRDAEGPRTYAVRWSIDGFASNLNIDGTFMAPYPLLTEAASNTFFYNDDVTTSTKGSKVEFPANVAITASTPVTFRIYAWNAENATGDFIVDDIYVNSNYSLIEDVQNYMDYSHCSYHFSWDQVKTMRTTLNSVAGKRNFLIMDSIHLLTGIDTITFPNSPLTHPQSSLTVPTCTPIPDFNAPRQVCQGENITFTDHSFNAVVDSWEWTFQDGSPATSNQQNPSVSFTSPGWKSVTLKVTNSAGEETITRDSYVYVSALWGDFTGPASIDLENGYDSWFINNNYENNWAHFHLKDGVGKDLSKAFKLNVYKNVANADFLNDDYFYNSRLGNTVDELITPSFDLRNTTNVTVSFDYSYATNGVLVEDITELINVYSSTDCGRTWIPRTVKKDGSIIANDQFKGANIVTAGFAGGIDFAPTTNTEWANVSLTYNPTSADDHTRFKIKFTASDNASNLYIDNFNVDGTLSLTSQDISELDLDVYPNPTTTGNAINVSYNAQEEPVKFTLRDAAGKVVAEDVITKTNTSVNQTLKGTENLRSACYFLEISSGEHTATRKVVVL